jgi:hypothetical protein
MRWYSSIKLLAAAGSRTICATAWVSAGVIHPATVNLAVMVRVTVFFHLSVHALGAHKTRRMDPPNIVFGEAE